MKSTPSKSEYEKLVAEMAAVLSEMVEIFDDVRIDGRIDSFTLQPARDMVAKAKQLNLMTT